MDKKLENIILKNDKIGENIKQAVIDIFSRIYSELGKQDFARWLEHSKISDRAKSLIFKICDRNEDEYLREN